MFSAAQRFVFFVLITSSVPLLISLHVDRRKDFLISSTIKKEINTVDDHFAWFHIEKTGTSFVNVLLHYACSNATKKIKNNKNNATKDLLLRAVHPYERVTSNNKYICARKYLRYPFLSTASNTTGAYHQALTNEIYEYNKGKLIGLFREPRQHRVSLLKHKYLEIIQHRLWLDFSRIRRNSANETSFMVMLDFLRGYETAMVLGDRDLFRRNVTSSQIDLHLSAAKTRLQEGFQFIGITNRYSESVCLFNMKFGGECKQVMFQKVNQASDHPDAFKFSEADWRYFEKYDDYIDRQLYNYVENIFEKELELYKISEKNCAAIDCWPQGANWLAQ